MYLQTLRTKQSQRKHKEENTNKSRNSIENKHKTVTVSKGVSWPFENINKHAKPFNEDWGIKRRKKT